MVGCYKEEAVNLTDLTLVDLGTLLRIAPVVIRQGVTLSRVCPTLFISGNYDLANECFDLVVEFRRLHVSAQEVVATGALLAIYIPGVYSSTVMCLPLKVMEEDRQVGCQIPLGEGSYDIVLFLTGQIGQKS